MHTLVIYDNITGKIYHIIYGEENLETPQGIPWMWVDVPDGGILDRIDVTDPNNPCPVFSYKPESDMGRLQREMKAVQETTYRLDSIINPSINIETCHVNELKAWQVNKSKEELATYLAEHPLVSTCHANKEGTYTITSEKRNLFTSKYSAHMALVAAGIDDQMSWNEAGRECEPWTDEECIHFISEWNAISTPLVAYQQSYELSIMDCETKEAILAIPLDYSSADPRNITTNITTE